MKFSQKNESSAIKLTIFNLLVTGVLTITPSFENNNFFKMTNLEVIFENLQPRNFLRKYSNLEKNQNTCDADLLLYRKALEKFELWALKMVDASTKIPSGILEGNIIDLGMYDECISIKKKIGTKTMKGKHCIYELKIILPANVTSNIKLTFAMCIPSTCDINDVYSIISKINEELHKRILPEDINISVGHATCSNLNYGKWSIGSIITLTVILFIIFFLLVCTILESIQIRLKVKYGDRKIITILSKFSLLNNSLKILSTKVSPESIPTIHGIRALSILWIIYGHEVLSRVNSGYVNTSYFLDWITSWKCIYLAMGVFAVDTFLMLSGFLLSFLFLKRMSKGGKFNLFEYYLHRYIRLTPALAALIFITMYIAPHLSSGPRWEENIIKDVSQKCEGAWWKILLYVQNYVGKNTSENLMCMGHLWYLSVDMQLFLLSPLILYPLSEKPKIGLIILGLFFIASIMIPAIIVAENELIFNLLSPYYSEKVIDSTRKVYTITHCRASPWIFGIFFGFIMTRNNKKPTKKLFIWGWIFAIICFIICTWGYSVLLDRDYEYNLVLEITFASLSHFIWAMGVAWIIYACHHGYGGMINNFLSLPIFLPLSKISYSLYLLHYFILSMISGSSRLSGYFSDFTVLQSYLGDLILCSVLSFFFCIIFESPIIILERIIFGKEKKRNESHQEDISFDHVEKGKTVINLETNEPTTYL